MAHDGGSWMRRVLHLEEYVANPIGAFYVDRVFAYFYPHEDLSGYVVWGNPTAADFEVLARILPVMHAPSTKPHAVLLDVRAMESLEAGAFKLAVKYTVDHFAAFHRAITRFGMVRGTGVGGAIAAGFFKVAPLHSPLRIFTQPRQALEWMGRASDVAAYEAFRRELEAVHAEPSLLSRVREALDAELGSSIDGVARKLSTSPRTLQRKLSEAGTSFSKETASAQLRLAQRLLLETDTSITEIAYRVGCSSAQHFSTLFRKETGETPSEWRANRAGQNPNAGA